MASRHDYDGASMRRIVQDYTRAAGGGLLIGLPLLFTQEVWQQGFTLEPSRILALLAVAFVIVLGYNAISGFRADQSLSDVVIDAVEAMGLGIIVAAAALTLLGRIEVGISLRDALGKIALESIPVAFGASIARGQLAQAGGGDEQDGTSGQGGARGRRGSRRADAELVTGPIGPFARLFVAAGGGLLFALNVGPTDEIVVLGMESSPWALVGLMAGSLVVTLALVFVAEFRGGAARGGEGPLEGPIGETLVAYALSLLVALTILWALGRTDDASLVAIAGMTVVLGVAASLGAAVGRILVGGEAAQ
jgi:putative integral membrane protein (TIGR02587 family)